MEKSLSVEEVRHVAKLADLHLTKRELSKLQKQLSSVLKYVEVLNEVDTTTVKPTSQVTGLENIFRSDEVGKEGLSQKEALLNTASKKRGFFKIKKIL